MQFNEEVAPAAEFPPWHYAEVRIGKERRIVAVFHCETPAGLVAYWYDDPQHPQRALPLLRSMRPVCLGDYGLVLRQEDHMEIFVAICKAIDDLPVPLLMVQAIYWIKRRGLELATNERLVAKQAMSAVEQAAQRRRRAYDKVLQNLCVEQAA